MPMSSWVIDEVAGNYKFYSSLLASPITYDAGTDTVVIPARPLSVTPVATFESNFFELLKWRKILGERLGLPPLPVLFDSNIPDSTWPANLKMDLQYTTANLIEFSFKVLPLAPKIIYTYDWIAKTVTLSASTGSTHARKNWDLRTMAVNHLFMPLIYLMK